MCNAGTTEKEANGILNTWVFAAICIGLWLGPVIVIVAIKRIARLFDIDLRRQPPPDEPDYRRW